MSFRAVAASHIRVLALAVSCLAASACSGGDGGGGTTEPPPGPKPVATVSVSLASSSIFTTKTTQGTATLADATGAALTGRTITWSSSAPAVATVDQNGLVTGVAAGSAQITATSESKSGSAALTVAVDPATTVQVKINAITRNGVAVDFTKVAGTVQLDILETVPTGFVGTIITKFRTTELSRSTYPIQTSASSAEAADATARRVVVSETPFATTFLRNTDFASAIPVAVITNNDPGLSVLHRNGIGDILTTLAGTVNGVPVQSSATQSITLANPSGAKVGFGRWNDSKPSVLINGNRWNAAEQLDVRIVSLDYDALPAADIDRVEILQGGATTVYGADAIAGVVNLITGGRRLFDSGTWACESRTNGTMFQVRTVTTSGVLRDPKVTPYAVNGITIDADRDGWADFASPPAGYDLGTGITGSIIIPDVVAALPTGLGWFNLKLPFFCDNRPPIVGLNAYTFLGRGNTPWGSIALINGRIGSQDNVLANDVDLSTFFDPTKLSDGSSGLNPSSYKFYFGAPSTLSQLITPQFRINTGSLLPISANFDQYSGFSAEDQLGNQVQGLLQTTTINPRTIGGAIGTPGQTASIRSLSGAAGTISLAGWRDRSWFNSSSLSGNYSFTSTGLTTGNYLTATLKKDGVCLGGGTTCSQLLVPLTTVGNEARFTLNSVTSQFGGNMQGVYDVSVFPYDNAGRNLLPMTTRLRSIIDFTAPSAPTLLGGNVVTAPFTAATPFTFNFTAVDNVHVAQVEVWANFAQFLSGLWDRAFVAAPIKTSPYTSPYNALRTTATSNVVSTLPTYITLLPPNGIPGSTFYPITGYSLTTVDGTDLRSGYTDNTISSMFLPSRVVETGLRFEWAHDKSSVCVPRANGGSSPCSPSLTATSTYTGRVYQPLNDPRKITEMDVYAMNSAGRPTRICRLDTPTISQIAAELRYEFACAVDWDEFKGPPDALTVFCWFFSITGNVYKSQFLTVILLQGSRVGSS